MSVLDLRRSWTIADLRELPDDGFRYELVDGQLVVTPGPTQRHQRLAARFRDLIRPALPPGWDVTTEFAVPFSEDTMRQPDVVVYRWPPRHPRPDPDSPVGPADVGLAVEVVSPSTRRNDRFAKPGEYADAGIPVYWRVETSPEVVLHTFVLEGSVYRPAAVLTGQGTAPLPWGDLDLDVGVLERG